MLLFQSDVRSRSLRNLTFKLQVSRVHSSFVDIASCMLSAPTTRAVVKMQEQLGESTNEVRSFDLCKVHRTRPEQSTVNLGGCTERPVPLAKLGATGNALTNLKTRDIDTLVKSCKAPTSITHSDQHVGSTASKP